MGKNTLTCSQPTWNLLFSSEAELYKLLTEEKALLLFNLNQNCVYNVLMPWSVVLWWPTTQRWSTNSRHLNIAMSQYGGVSRQTSAYLLSLMISRHSCCDTILPHRLQSKPPVTTIHTLNNQYSHNHGTN